MYNSLQRRSNTSTNKWLNETSITFTSGHLFPLVFLLLSNRLFVGVRFLLLRNGGMNSNNNHTCLLLKVHYRCLLCTFHPSATPIPPTWCTLLSHSRHFHQEAAPIHKAIQQAQPHATHC